MNSEPQPKSLAKPPSPPRKQMGSSLRAWRLCVTRCFFHALRFPWYRQYPKMKQVEYDTGMSEEIGLRVRALPDGEFQPASETGWKGRLLELDLAGGHFPLGALLEIEQGAMVYLGELQQRIGSTVVVAIEHSVNCDALKPIRETWG
jgi:hypothetical protein